MRSGPYQGRTAVIATMHGKEQAAGPAMAELGLALVVPRSLDTDRFGTFTGEVPRTGTMREVAVAKARAAMAAEGLPLGIASEGSFGPHPSIPFVAAGRELCVFVDDERGLIISESAVTATNLAHADLAVGDDPGAFLRQIGFPATAVIVRPLGRSDTTGLRKGLRACAEVDEAVADACALSPERRCRIETDMRAHLNPVRMAELAGVFKALAARMASTCPACAMPGYGRTGSWGALPCRECGSPSAWAAGEIWSCPACRHGEQRPRPDGLTEVDPMHCPVCNP